MRDYHRTSAPGAPLTENWRMSNKSGLNQNQTHKGPRGGTPYHTGEGGCQSRLLTVGTAVGWPVPAVTKRLEGSRGRAEGGTDRHPPPQAQARGSRQPPPDRIVEHAHAAQDEGCGGMQHRHSHRAPAEKARAGGRRPGLRDCESVGPWRAVGCAAERTSGRVLRAPCSVAGSNPGIYACGGETTGWHATRCGPQRWRPSTPRPQPLGSCPQHMPPHIREGPTLHSARPPSRAPSAPPRRRVPRAQLLSSAAVHKVSGAYRKAKPPTAAVPMSRREEGGDDPKETRREARGVEPDLIPTGQAIV